MTIDAVCDAFSLKRDAYYKYRNRFVIKKQIEKDVVQLVRKSRRTVLREGTRKLMKSLSKDFKAIPENWQVQAIPYNNHWDYS
ncbi:hypothetical protein [Pricia sp.]|uniref:hypothetical protein n=1 Tax=Pricia sp. TaxID=2268138 RepID=UPI0035936F1D